MPDGRGINEFLSLSFPITLCYVSDIPWVLVEGDIRRSWVGIDEGKKIL